MFECFVVNVFVYYVVVYVFVVMCIVQYFLVIDNGIFDYVCYQFQFFWIVSCNWIYFYMKESIVCCIKVVVNGLEVYVVVIGIYECCYVG